MGFDDILRIRDLAELKKALPKLLTSNDLGPKNEPIFRQSPWFIRLLNDSWIEGAQLAFDNGLEINKEMPDGSRLIHHVRSIEGLRELLKREADICAKNIDGLTVLHIHCLNSRVDLLEVLSEEAPRDFVTCLKIKCKDGFVPLHCAAEKADFTCVDFLLSKGANPNVCTKRDQTVFSLLASAAEWIDEKQKVKCCEALFKYGGVPNQKTLEIALYGEGLLASVIFNKMKENGLTIDSLPSPIMNDPSLRSKIESMEFQLFSEQGGRRVTRKI